MTHINTYVTRICYNKITFNNLLQFYKNNYLAILPILFLLHLKICYLRFALFSVFFFSFANLVSIFLCSSLFSPYVKECEVLIVFLLEQMMTVVSFLRLPCYKWLKLRMEQLYNNACVDVKTYLNEFFVQIKETETICF